MLFGYFSRFGYPIYLGNRSQHQLRPGLGVGMCVVAGSNESDPGFCISPTFSYVYQTGGWYHLGVSIGTAISIGDKNYPLVISLFTPLGWTGSAD